MPLKIDFRLIASKSGRIAPFTGGYVRGWFLSNVKQKSQELFTYLHEGKEIRPYAVSPLRPIGKRMKIVDGKWSVEEGDELTFGISILKEDIEEKVFQIILDVDKFSFGNISCELDHIIARKHDYEELGSRTVGLRIGITFRTPTLFNIRGREFAYLYPDPIRVIGNLLNIWNKFSPRDLKMQSDEIIDWVSRSIKTKSYKLLTREVTIEGAKITGFKGKVEWIILNDQELVNISALMSLAEFSNIGSKRTYGLGVVKVTDLLK